MAKSKSRAKTKKGSGDEELIAIDEAAGLIFESEEELFGYFMPFIQALESEYLSLRGKDDFTEKEEAAHEIYLESTLEKPDEIWEDSVTFPEIKIHHFIKNIPGGFYLASAYLNSQEQTPTFVLIHLATKDPAMKQNYQRGEQVFDSRMVQVEPAAIEGDSLLEGDPLAMGLFLSMVKVRSDKDIPMEKFKNFAEQREETIESADEVWRKTDHEGHVLVTFIKEFPDHEIKELHYVVVTQEEDQGGVHSLLFSFPTTDEALLDRYRQGENLQTEEIAQESSH